MHFVRCRSSTLAAAEVAVILADLSQLLRAGAIPAAILVLSIAMFCLRKKLAAFLRAVRTMMAPPAIKTLKEEDVIAAEQADLARRRDVAFRNGRGNDADDHRDAVGLALSGGGIRSAMFNLGVLQAIHAVGLYRYLDYLSAVSGGSYLGVHLASQMKKLDENSPSGRPNLREDFPLKPEPTGAQPHRVRRFIRRGNYLDRPWEFFFAYFGGLFLNLLVFGVALLFVCTLLACIWRWFDQPDIRAAVALNENDPDGLLHNLTPDLVRPFIPTLLLLLPWWWAGWWFRRRLREAKFNYDHRSVERALRFPRA